MIAVREGSLTDRTLDLLTIEGGWWSTWEIAERLNANPKSAEKALYRMLERGLVQRSSGRPDWRVR